MNPDWVESRFFCCHRSKFAPASVFNPHVHMYPFTCMWVSGKVKLLILAVTITVVAAVEPQQQHGFMVNTSGATTTPIHAPAASPSETSISDVITIKIGLFGAGKPSQTDLVILNGADLNEQVWVMEAVVEYYNKNLLPPNIKFQIVYSDYVDDQSSSSKSDLMEEAIRFQREQNLAFVMSYLDDDKTMALRIALAETRTLLCSLTSNDFNVQFGGQRHTYMSTEAMSTNMVWAFGAGVSYLQLSKSIFLYEDTYWCQYILDAMPWGEQYRGLTIVDKIRTPAVDADDESFRSWPVWSKIIANVRDSKVRVVLHCGSSKNLYALVEEAVKQGLMDDRRTVWVLTTAPENDIAESGFGHLRDYLYGTISMDMKGTIENSLDLDSRANDEYPYYNHIKKVLNESNFTSPFKTAGPPKATVGNAKFAACAVHLVPAIKTLSENPSQYPGFDNAMATYGWNVGDFWKLIRDGHLLRMFLFFEHIRPTIEERGYRRRKSDARIFDSVFGFAPYEFLNAKNKTALDQGSFLQSFEFAGLIEDRSLGYGNFDQYLSNFRFPDGSSNPPRMYPVVFERERSASVFMGIFAVTVILETTFLCILVALIVRRRTLPVRNNSFVFLLVIIFGCLVQLASALLGFFEKHDTTPLCRARSYLEHLGFATAFGAIISLEYRLYRDLFGSAQLQGEKKAKQPQVRTHFSYHGALLFPIFLIILLVDTFTTPSGKLQEQSQLVDDLTTETWLVCRVTVCGYILQALEILVLVSGTALAARIKQSDDEFYQAQRLGIAIYNAFLLFMVGSMVEFVVTRTPEIALLIPFLRIALTATSIIGTLCVPVLLPMASRERMSTQTTVRGTSSNARGTSTTMAQTKTVNGSEKLKPQEANLLAEVETLEKNADSMAQKIAELEQGILSTKPKNNRGDDEAPEYKKV